MATSQVQIGQNIDGIASGEWFGYSVATSADGSVIAVGAPRSAVNGIISSGKVRVFQHISGTWAQIGQDIEGILSGEGTGYSISLSSNGKIIAIGNPWDNNGNNSAGYVQVYQNVSGVWTQLGQDITGNVVGEQFGYSVALSSDGTILAAGAPYYAGNGGTRSGQVRVYRNVSGTWTQIGQDIDDGEVASEFSGYGISLSSDGTILAVGTHRGGDLSTPAKVRVYRNVSGIWTKIGNDIVGEAVLDTSLSVSLSANGLIIAIGARFNDGNGKDSGHVRIYENLSGVWTQIGNDIDGEAAGDLSGWSVSLSADGNTVAIGAPINNGNGTNSGHVRIYKNILGNWIQRGIDIDGETAGDNSGWSVSLSADGKTVAIGAPNNKKLESGIQFGHVRVYDISGVLSTNDFISESFDVYPNPASEVLNIRMKNNLSLENVTVYNNLGQIVKTAQQNTIDVSTLSEGIYFVEVTTNQGKAVKKVIVK